MPGWDLPLLYIGLTAPIRTLIDTLIVPTDWSECDEQADCMD
uniref:Uncharacterized protein n=1 Tax=Pseudomonas marincola TaxID=437900 RepID=A0A653DZE2_9PSED